MNLLSDALLPEFHAILSLLRSKALSLSQIAEALSQPQSEIAARLTHLETDGAVLRQRERWHLNRAAFQKATETLLPFAERENLPSETGEMAAQLFQQREEQFRHAPLEQETAFYESICSGNLDAVHLLATPLCSEGYGTLSSDPLRNLKYHLTISIAMITRFCIHSGMASEDAFPLSDFYIQKTDKCQTASEVHAVHQEMILDFTRRMQRIRDNRTYSKTILLAMDYVSEHLHERILIQDAAAALSISVPYLSRLFKSEIGTTFSDYVRDKKVDAAIHLLKYSTHSAAEVSSILGFSSQSYFIKIFKTQTGMTPKEYRKKYHFT